MGQKKKITLGELRSLIFDQLFCEGDDHSSKDSWGAQLRQRRIDYGLTQPELARELDVSMSYLKALESDVMEPSQEALDDIRSFFPGMPSTTTGSTSRNRLGAIDPTFGRELRAQLAHEGLTATDFANLLGFPRESFSRLINGGIRVPRWMLDQIYELLPQMRSVPVQVARDRNYKKSRAVKS